MIAEYKAVILKDAGMTGQTTGQFQWTVVQESDHDGDGCQTLRTQDSSDPRHFGTTLAGPKCPDTSDPVPKCLLDTSDLSAEVSYP